MDDLRYGIRICDRWNDDPPLEIARIASCRDIRKGERAPTAESIVIGRCFASLSGHMVGLPSLLCGCGPAVLFVF